MKGHILEKNNSNTRFFNTNTDVTTLTQSVILIGAQRVRLFWINTAAFIFNCWQRVPIFLHRSNHSWKTLQCVLNQATTKWEQLTAEEIHGNVRKIVTI